MAPTQRAYGDGPDRFADEYGRNASTLVLHGGFWRARYTYELMDAFCSDLAERGISTWNAEYRRVGAGGGYPETLADVAAACRALDVTVAVGHSAGGHLALWAAAEGLVDGAVSLGGVCDLVAAADDRLGDGAVFDFLGGPPSAHPDADPAQRLPLRGRVLLVHGSADDTVPVEHARRFAEQSGCELIELEGAGHFDVIDPRSAFWQSVADAIQSFVD
jgi:pimeloyl-ACP methyl ester carboxylesterase